VYGKTASFGTLAMSIGAAPRSARNSGRGSSTCSIVSKQIAAPHETSKPDDAGFSFAASALRKRVFPVAW
jgi:hypothetical protein